MGTAHNLQRQHGKLTAMAGDLVTLAFGESAPAIDVQRALARFSGTLRTHASMEAEGLYPHLLAHPNWEIRQRAERLKAELGPLYARWDTFMGRWSSAEAIETDLSRFRTDLGRTLAVLGKRMHREDQELYPMVEAL